MFVARVKRQSDESQEEKKFSRDGEKSAKSIRHVESTPQMQRLSRESINLNQKNHQRSALPYSLRYQDPDAPIKWVVFCIYVPITNQQSLVVPQTTQTDAPSKIDFSYKASTIECPDNFIRCTDGTECVSKSSWCDNKVDCLDASDESRCSCLDRIRVSKLCDNYQDCPNGEDELGCFGCSKDKYSCDGRITTLNNGSNCFDSLQRCDENRDCDNGMDEKGCIVINKNLTNLKEMFPVSFSSGFIHVRKDKWYIACGYAYDWALEACESELGSSNSTPKVRLLPNEKLSSEGPYITPDGRIKTSCPSFLHVECPSPIVGSTKMIPQEEDPIVSIVGGRDSHPQAWPFIVSITKNGRFNCGGVIVNDLWILSAAHCFKKYQSSYFEVNAGSVRRLSYPSTLQTRRVVGIHVHEGYNPFSYSNDIILAMLDEPLYFNSWVQPVRLPEPFAEVPTIYGWRRQDVPSLGTRCIAVGWGSTWEGGPEPDYLKEVEVPILRCKYQEDINDATICAGYLLGGRDSCQGDSGGPLMCKESNLNSEWYLGGIVSHGIGCGRINEPGIYSKVSHFVPWINSIINSRKTLESLARPLTKCPGFSCYTYPRCLPGNKRCDRNADCLGAEDETGCFLN